MRESNNLENKLPEIELMQLPVPESVSMWPDTLAWDLLLTALAILVIFTLWSLFRKHQRSLWKREAHALAIQANSQASADIWFALIKRIHLVHNDKSTIKKRTDAELLSELRLLQENEVQTLTQAHYRRNDSLSESTSKAIYQAVTDWLNNLPEVQNV